MPTALQLQPEDQIQAAHETPSVEVQVGREQHRKQQRPPPASNEAILGAGNNEPPSDSKISEDAVRYHLQMSGSLEHAVRMLGGDAPPLDDALAGLNQARDLELAADDEMSALTMELSQILTPVEPFSPAAAN
eukprot:COSAG02_NODE_4957_length_4782_cov_2.868674_1_plen_132_part_10